MVTEIGPEAGFPPNAPPHFQQPGESKWSFPVVPPGAYYAATLHDLTGALNDGYAHTGIDLNLDREPYGDVDRGLPVFAIAAAAVEALDFHERYRGCVILKAHWHNKPLWIRYWHLSDTCMTLLQVGQRIEQGALLGHIGSYPDAGDHLHFDMALDRFEPRWWFTRHGDVRWVDPVDILLDRCTISEVEAMIRKGGEE